MKKLIIIALMAFTAVPSFAAANIGEDYDWPPPTGIGRGVVNIVTSSGEIVRDVVYYGGCGYENAGGGGAIIGGLFGVIPGSVMCVGRVVDGVLDCFTLGIWGNAVTHSEEVRDFFPVFFWNDLWLPESLR